MRDYFYHVFTEYEDYNFDYGYYHTLARVYADSVEYNRECGNSVCDYENVQDHLDRSGRAYIGCHVIEKIEYSD